jgi:hypothetical protein
VENVRILIEENEAARQKAEKAVAKDKEAVDADNKATATDAALKNQHEATLNRDSQARDTYKTNLADLRAKLEKDSEALGTLTGSSLYGFSALSENATGGPFLGSFLDPLDSDEFEVGHCHPLGLQ